MDVTQKAIDLMCYEQLDDSDDDSTEVPVAQTNPAPPRYRYNLRSKQPPPLISQFRKQSTSEITTRSKRLRKSSIASSPLSQRLVTLKEPHRLEAITDEIKDLYERLTYVSQQPNQQIDTNEAMIDVASICYSLINRIQPVFENDAHSINESLDLSLFCPTPLDSSFGLDALSPLSNSSHEEILSPNSEQDLSDLEFSCIEPCFFDFNDFNFDEILSHRN